jgi:hypothetical protein
MRQYNSASDVCVSYEFCNCNCNSLFLKKIQVYFIVEFVVYRYEWEGKVNEDSELILVTII